jgi:subtilisin family serine protease
MAVAQANQALALGHTGSGVRVAVFEDGPSDLTNLRYEARYQANPSASAHARLTSAIIKNVEAQKPHGYAPDCSLYSANSYDNAALNWAIQEQTCTVVSQSFHRDTEQTSGELSGDDLLKDWLALRLPFPTIIHAAGNGAASEYVNHKGYNTISVGNHDDQALAMAGSSVFRNPPSLHSDRELPELAANGTTVSAVGHTDSGTSFAAPAVAGTVTLIQSVDDQLKSWPEACRAILFAAADRNVTGGTWTADLPARIDQSDGAGALNALMAVSIAQQHQQRNSAAMPRGWDVGSLTTESFGTDGYANFRYHVTVPQSILASPLVIKTVKIALAWDSKITQDAAGTATSSILTVDLDLYVRDSTGVTVSSSVSFDNSYEIIEFQGTAGMTYDILIRRASGTDQTWYGIAWNVTSRFTRLDPILVETE